MPRIDLSVYDVYLMREIEKCGTVVVTHGSLPARAGRGGYPAMVYAGGELLRWRRQTIYDRLWIQGLLDIEVVWSAATQNYDVVYIRRWRTPVQFLSSSRRAREGLSLISWEYEELSSKEILSLVSEKLSVYSAIADLASVVRNVRNYCLTGEEEDD